MRFHSQNLTRDGSMFWNGRAWWSRFRCEWGFGKNASDFSLYLNFGGEDDGTGLQFHLCLPRLFSIYFTVLGIVKCAHECQCGIAIHNCAFWVYPLSYRMHSADENDPWYRRHYSWAFPWELNWYSTEILTPDHASRQKVLFREDTKNRKSFLEGWDQRQQVAAEASEHYDFTYTLKDGTVQKRTATIYVERMEWRARWWPIIPRKKIRTSIDIKFDQAVGKRVHTWKGGVTGTGCEMHPWETPYGTLRRFEAECKL